MEKMNFLELCQLRSSKTKELQDLEMRIEKLYSVGDTDQADYLDIVSGVIYDEIFEIESIIGYKSGGEITC